MAGTKVVEIHLSALTRVEYTEALEVPEDITAEELEELVNQRYDEVDGAQYTEDMEYWEKGWCRSEPASGHLEVTGRVVRSDDGLVVNADGAEPVELPAIMPAWREKVQAAIARLGEPRIVFAAHQDLNKDIDRRGRDGQEVRILRVGFDAAEEPHWGEETLPYFRVQFPDGETTDVYDEELFSHDPRYLELLTALSSGFVVARECGFDGPHDLDCNGEAEHREYFLERVDKQVVTACLQVPWTPKEFRVTTTEPESGPSL